MSEAKVAHEVSALRALARAGPAQDEEDEGLVLAGAGGEERGGAGRGGEVVFDVCGRHGGVSGLGFAVFAAVDSAGVDEGGGLGAAACALAFAGFGEAVEEEGAEAEDEDEGENRELVRVGTAGTRGRSGGDWGLGVLETAE